MEVTTCSRELTYLSFLLYRRKETESGEYDPCEQKLIDMDVYETG